MSENVPDFMNQWREMVLQHAKDTEPQLRQAARDVRLQHLKDVPAKVVHRNGGSLRQRKVRQYFGRVNKTIVTKESMLLNVVPTNVEPMTTHADGSVTFSVTFAQV